MRSAFSAVRFIRSLHQPAAALHARPPLRAFRPAWRLQPFFRAPGRGGSRRTLLAAAGSSAALGAVTLARLSDDDDDDSGGTGQTVEMRELEAARAEMTKRADNDSDSSPWREAVLLYIWEPLCTGFRFLQLVVIFVPVIVAVPAIWLGRRQPERDNERSGTLWWYGFLVQGMERAGPAFIKVRK